MGLPCGFITDLCDGGSISAMVSASVSQRTSGVLSLILISVRDRSSGMGRGRRFQSRVRQNQSNFAQDLRTKQSTRNQDEKQNCIALRRVSPSVHHSSRTSLSGRRGRDLLSFANASSLNDEPSMSREIVRVKGTNEH